MLRHRVIPCLLLSGEGLVKTTKFQSPSYVGDPLNAIRIFNEKEVDELIVLDIDASRQGRAPDFNRVEQVASECFMPLCYGGGVASVEHAKTLFSLGVEKVSIQSAALSDLRLVSEIASRFGSQSVVVSIDVKRNLFGKPKLYGSSRRNTSNVPWQEVLKKAVAAGAGEILLNAVDKDGTLSGMDLGLIGEASAICDAPLIAAGGAGSVQDLRAAVDAGADAICAGAMFVYHGPRRAVLITYPLYSQLQALLDS